jgi:hypothetical protein
MTHVTHPNTQDWRHVATFNALADRVVPADELPGAVASGAAGIILMALDRELAPHKDDVEQFLELLDQQAADTRGVSFAMLNAQDQDAILRKVEHAPAFRWLADHISTAYWSTPAGLQGAGFEVRG